MISDIQVPQSAAQVNTESNHHKKEKKHKKHHKKHRRSQQESGVSSDHNHEGTEKEKHKKEKKDKKKKKKKSKKRDSTQTESEGDDVVQEVGRQEPFGKSLGESQSMAGKQQMLQQLQQKQNSLQGGAKQEETKKRVEAAATTTTTSNLANKKRKAKKMGEDEGDSRDDETYRPGAGKKKRPPPQVVKKEEKKIEVKNDNKSGALKTTDKPMAGVQNNKSQTPSKQQDLQFFLNIIRTTDSLQGGLGSAIVSINNQSNSDTQKKEQPKTEQKKKEKDVQEEPKRTPYEIHFYNNLIPQCYGVKKRLIKMYQSSKARKWESRWVLHPNSRSKMSNQEADVWVRKWVSHGILDPLLELNAHGLTLEELDLLKRLQSVEESDYANGFYDFESYLQQYKNTYICEVTTCQKLYFDLKMMKQHMLLKHGIVEKQEQGSTMQNKKPYGVQN